MSNRWYGDILNTHKDVVVLANMYWTSTLQVCQVLPFSSNRRWSLVNRVVLRPCNLNIVFNGK